MLISAVASFEAFAELCESLSQTSSRLQMADLAGEFLAGLDAEEAPIAARFMVGRALPVGSDTPLNISGRAIWKVAAELAGAADSAEEIFAAAIDFGEAVEMAMRLRASEPAPTLTIAAVYRAFGEIAAIEGRQSRQRKLAALRALLAQATNLEAKYLAKILVREMRHGLSEGVLLEAIARATGSEISLVRRTSQLEGDPGAVLSVLRGEPRVALPERRMGPLKPMLAQSADSVDEALAVLGPELALEHKLDGARVQIHAGGGATAIYSRRLNQITPSLPEIVELMEGRLSGRRAIFDGEAVAVDSAGRPQPFQELMRRFGRVREIDRARTEQPIRLYLFDLIALEGRLLIDLPYRERYAALEELALETGLELAPRCLPASAEEGGRFYADAVAAGMEGVMAKGLHSHYTPGARGRGWLKIKRARTLDLVIVAADWGYGRRHGWLSNYHLAARDEHSGQFVEVGKTFKGPTDDQFRDLTQRLLALKTDAQAGTVYVRPQLVVEVAYSDIQRSPQYAGGMALRFARLVRIRDDKAPAEADTLEHMTREFERQSFPKPAQ